MAFFTVVFAGATFAVAFFAALFSAVAVVAAVFVALLFSAASVFVAVLLVVAVVSELRVVRDELMLRRYDSVPVERLHLTAPGSTVKPPPRPVPVAERRSATLLVEQRRRRVARPTRPPTVSRP
jgi:hypothetical protein